MHDIFNIDIPDFMKLLAAFYHVISYQYRSKCVLCTFLCKLDLSNTVRFPSTSQHVPTIDPKLGQNFLLYRLILVTWHPVEWLFRYQHRHWFREHVYPEWCFMETWYECINGWDVLESRLLISRVLYKKYRCSKNEVGVVNVKVIESSIVHPRPQTNVKISLDILYGVNRQYLGIWVHESGLASSVAHTHTGNRIPTFFPGFPCFQ
jgi:hypothetical protein